MPGNTYMYMYIVTSTNLVAMYMYMAWVASILQTSPLACVVCTTLLLLYLVSFCQQVVVDKTNQPWVLYDAGPRHVRSPLICLPPVCGTADVFFRQLLDLSQAGYRVISVSYCDLIMTNYFIFCATLGLLDEL